MKKIVLYLCLAIVVGMVAGVYIAMQNNNEENKAVLQKRDELIRLRREREKAYTIAKEFMEKERKRIETMNGKGDFPTHRDRKRNKR